MQTRRERITVLYVTGEYAPESSIEERLDTDRTRFVKTTLTESHRQTASPDCLLLGAQARDEQYLTAVERLR
jgi:hypothetical protein